MGVNKQITASTGMENRYSVSGFDIQFTHLYNKFAYSAKPQLICKFGQMLLGVLIDEWLEPVWVRNVNSFAGRVSF